MTWRGRFFALWPAAYLLGLLVSLAWLLHGQGWLQAAWTVFYLYGVPVCAYRLHHWMWPVEEGVFTLDRADHYVPWWGGHNCQLIYDAVPQMEALLRVVPGLYSCWLRAWGAKIGRGVYWTPAVEITDRAMLVIGDGAVIGHRVGFYAHLVTRKADGELKLLVKRIRVGERALIGAGSRFGPGAVVEDGALLPALTDRWHGGRPPPQS